jgi:hypothetical protein
MARQSLTAEEIERLPLPPGPCLICETGLPASHRVIDAINERIEAGEDRDAVLLDYGIAPEPR